MNSKKGKGLYATYKSGNSVFKNKIKKLERHVKRFPEDEQGKINLERIKKAGYIGRAKPLVPGSNQTTAKPKFNPSLLVLTGQTGHTFGPKTAGEQLSELLGRPMPRVRTKRKPKTVITHKPRRK